MTEPIRCPRCRRAFGGYFTFRRAHPDKQCRKIVGLRAIGLHLNGGGVWRRPGPGDPVQLKLPIFGRGRPRKYRTQYIRVPGDRRRAVPGTRGRRRHEGSQLRLPLGVAA